MQSLFHSDSRMDNKLLNHFPADFSDSISILKQKNVYEVFESIVRSFNLQSVDDAFLKHFREKLIEFGLNESGSIAEFIDFWEDLIENEDETLDIAEDKDAIRIMTMHKSKGLQFPVVFIPYSSWRIAPKSRSTIWSDKNEQWSGASGVWPLFYDDLLSKSQFSYLHSSEYDSTVLDNLNILYVAFTRAEKILNIWTRDLPAKYDGKISSTNHLIVSALGSETIDKVYVSGSLENYSQEDKARKATRLFEGKVYESPERFLRLKKRDSSTFQSDATKYGVLFHNSMASIKEHNDLKTVLEEINKNSLITKTQKNQLNEDINKTLANNDISKWF